MKAHFILYVADQERSMEFYRRVLGARPSLHVPGMTEFSLSDGAVLGLMPEAGVARLLGSEALGLAGTARAPRCELYLVVEDAGELHRRAIESGARELSPVKPRDWGHAAGYCLDPEGHVLAFAEITTCAGTRETAP